MKLNLVVMTPGKNQGQSIPITLSQFLIGRDKQCHLRPASPIISNRHCALQVREGRVFVRDFNSMNGTFINDKAVKGEQELHDQDMLKIGPVAFQVRIEPGSPATKPVRTAKTPAKPAPKVKGPAQPVDDDELAALLLAVPDEGDVLPSGENANDVTVPEGSTIHDVPVPPSAAGGTTEASPPSADADQKGPTDRPLKKPEPAAKVKPVETASAADSLLKKYIRRSPLGTMPGEQK
jgi:pSer/pThr/pTyr-binding forkhead associated (FHA) protein